LTSLGTNICEKLEPKPHGVLSNQEHKTGLKVFFVPMCARLISLQNMSDSLTLEAHLRLTRLVWASSLS